MSYVAVRKKLFRKRYNWGILYTLFLIFRHSFIVSDSDSNIDSSNSNDSSDEASNCGKDLNNKFSRISKSSRNSKRLNGLCQRW
jgi:hypothetical protein